MTPAGRLRLSGLAERAERIGAALVDPGEIPEGIYDSSGHWIDVCPVMPDEIDTEDDESMDEYMDFALESENLMLDGTEAVIVRLEMRHARQTKVT